MVIYMRASAIGLQNLARAQCMCNTKSLNMSETCREGRNRRARNRPSLSQKGRASAIGLQN